jgi:cell division protein FtsB
VEKDKRMTTRAEHEIAVVEKDIKQEGATLEQLSAKIDRLEQVVRELVDRK